MFAITIDTGEKSSPWKDVHDLRENHSTLLHWTRRGTFSPRKPNFKLKLKSLQVNYRIYVYVYIYVYIYQ